MHGGKWLAPAILALLAWGVWGVALKKASQGLQWYQVYVYTNSAILVVMGTVVLLYGQAALRVPPSKAVEALTAGLLGTLGYVLLIVSLKNGGKASIVIPLTGLYPAVTTILSTVLLGEHLGFRKGLGVLLAMLAIIILSE